MKQNRRCLFNFFAPWGKADAAFFVGQAGNGP